MIDFDKRSRSTGTIRLWGSEKRAKSAMHMSRHQLFNRGDYMNARATFNAAVGVADKSTDLMFKKAEAIIGFRSI